MIRRLPRSTLVPYSTLFRSRACIVGKIYSLSELSVPTVSRLVRPGIDFSDFEWIFPIEGTGACIVGKIYSLSEKSVPTVSRLVRPGIDFSDFEWIFPIEGTRACIVGKIYSFSQ